MRSTVIVYPEVPMDGFSEMLMSLGCSTTAITSVDAISDIDEDASVTASIVSCTEDVEAAYQFCEALKAHTASLGPIIIVADKERPTEILEFAEFYEDFILAPFDLAELRLRVLNIQLKSGEDDQDSVVTYGPLEVDSTTFQAKVDGNQLDLSYIEYELLSFLVLNPGKVFSREVLLDRVWGFDYFGGARTVDVLSLIHI